jgi:chemotaxis signal transduction protein
MRGGREVFVLRAGARLFAVAAEEVEATAEGLTPAPLPFAPPSVVGVVSVRGRVRTALDPLRLARDGEADAAPSNSDDGDGDSNAANAANATDVMKDAGEARAQMARAQTSAAPPRLFVALRGDEQLALACDDAEGVIDVARSRITPPADARAPALGTFEHAGSSVTLLDTSRLFEAAMQGTDRRRKRS